MGVPILFDGYDIWIGLQDLQVIIGEGSSKAVDDVPFVRDLGLGADLASEGGDTSKAANVVLEGHNVTSGNGILGPLDQHKGRGGSESWENADGYSDELLGEHGGLGRGFLGRNPSQI